MKASLTTFSVLSLIITHSVLSAVTVVVVGVIVGVVTVVAAVRVWVD